MALGNRKTVLRFFGSSVCTQQWA